MNVIAGGAPTPNQVTVGLSATGAISAYNNGGTVDLLIDIVGYYQPAAAGTGTQGPKGDTGDSGKDGTNGTNGTNGVDGKTCPTSGCTVFYAGTDMISMNGQPSYDGKLCLAIEQRGYLPLKLPAGAIIKAVRVRYKGTRSTYELRSIDEAFVETVRSTVYSTASPSVSPAQLQLNTGLPAQARTVQYEVVGSPLDFSQAFCGAEVNYTF